MSRRAEALLRALVGVHEAEVSFRSAGAIASVRVAASGQASGLLIRNIRSALLAGLGVAVDPLQIELIDPALWTPTQGDVVPDPAPVPPAAPADATANGHGAAAVAPRNGSTRSPVAKGNGLASSAHAADAYAPVQPAAGEPLRAPSSEAPRAPQRARADALLGKGEGKRHSRARMVRPPATAAGGPERIDVERVDLVRHAGRLRCRVVIATARERFSAIADAADEAGMEIQLPGRVACDALRAGGLTSAQFESATIAYLAGRVHVVAALGDWKNGEPLPRSGSAIAGESLEHAAARAVLQAALAQPVRA